MRTIVRPIQQWPDPPTKRRERSRFDSGYESTKALLERECRHLGAREVVIQLAVAESDIRIDGTYPKASARIDHPGVIVSFESKHGPLRYSTDTFTNWLDNLRAIALGLEALRKVDRYGIGRGGEQYQGWNALPPGMPMGAAMTFEDACRVLGLDPTLAVGGEAVRQAFKHLSKTHHPDAGGDPEEFRSLVTARDLLLADSGRNAPGGES